MNSISKYIYNLLVKPFKSQFPFFVIILLFSSIVDLIGFSIFESVPKAIFICMHHFVICYFITFILCILPSKIRKWYRGLFFLLLGVNFLIDIICVYSFHFTFDQEVPAILLGTNSNEAIEFIHTFIPYSLVLIIIVSFLFFGFVYIKLRQIPLYIKDKYCIVLLLLVFLSLLSFATISNKNFGNVSITKVYTILNATSPPDLKDYAVHPQLLTLSEKKPKNIVMIIGESFSKTHSSLYGYHKNTNPCLKVLQNNGLLYIFNNIQTPALNTVPVFQSLMSTYKPEFKDSINWFECITIQGVLNEAGYYTSWISNQSQKGFHDNVIAKFAYLCDTSVFAGNRFAAMGKKDFDEIIIDSISKYKNIRDEQYYKFYFIHLMGSHPDFKKRYPLSFDIFKADDYPDKKKEQRNILASYDNSILYNDFVVSKIMNLFSEDEAIIFYFSDHALDVFDSRDDYVGHARYNDSKSLIAGSNIPFMVYMTPSFQSDFAEIKNILQSKLDCYYRIDDMIYTIMDIIGVRFKDNNRDNKQSLLNLY